MSADYSNRNPNQPIHTQFWRRWSPRAMTGEAIDQKTLDTLLEAARWAPSSYNRQPWRFIYALRGTPEFDTLFGLLAEGNKAWCKQAGALLVVVSQREYEPGKTSITHRLDAGAAWMSFALQGYHLGLVVHGMQGFDYDAAQKELGVPETFDVQMMIAVGHQGDASQLPEGLRKKEQPNTRKPFEEIAMAGRFKGD